MQVRTTIGASFAALFLILATPVMKIGSSAVGFPIFIATTRPECEIRTTVVDVADEHWLRVLDSGPATTLRTNELEGRLHEIFRTRAIAVVFITGSGDLPFRRIAEVIDIASRQADHVAILTPAVKFNGCVTINVSGDSPSLRAAFNRR